ncbi:hypothetical protein [Sphingomonas sp. CFBP 8760]|uniref:hypothetical protein n=1 Tax=Sphingomonas sp. CFBP 8760 TaxID=2775282 RepID=UPI00177B6BC7|nr:hypothetical protein [Sphingomonas sp. CFBP 8760]MBD8548785.1 hypothetical protein [Sphingomonas sp. CFBP 8760]
MIHILFFYGLLGTACLYAAWRGGGPERMTAAALIVATVATWVVAIGFGGSRAGRFIGVEYGVLVIDGLLVAALMAIALCADRFWPLWMTALHAFGIVGHLAKAIAPDILPNVYQAAHLFSAYPGLILLMLATHWHRMRLRRDGHDPSWSNFWRWSILRPRRIGHIG